MGVVVVVLIVGGVAVVEADPSIGGGAGCTVAAARQVDGFDRDQIRHATTIAEVAVDMDMPHLQRAVVVALATAMQESNLVNHPHLGAANDHDSLGLFQQRPSQGWGTPEQVQRPRYAARKFFQALRKVDGWQDMRITDAAQAVQRSAHPERYQQHAKKARRLAKALLRQCT